MTEAIVRNRGLPADRVIELKGGMLSLHKEYPSGNSALPFETWRCAGSGIYTLARRRNLYNCRFFIYT
jgi:hypothetical protein